MTGETWASVPDAGRLTGLSNSQMLGLAWQGVVLKEIEGQWMVSLTSLRDHLRSAA